MRLSDRARTAAIPADGGFECQHNLSGPDTYSPSSPEELDQWRKVLEFQKAFPKQGLWWPFKTTNKFKELVRQHLSGWLRDNLKK
jgi:hypothetical protein